MATCDEIEEALGCMECCDALETHLEYCQPDECGVFETYWRIRHRVEAGDCDDWLAPGRAAMVVMMTAEPWMHEHHDHRIVHDDKPITLPATDQPPEPALASVVSITEARTAKPLPPLTYERMAALVRDRLRRLTVAHGAPATKTTAVAAEQPEPPLWWEIHGPSGLVELHAELTVREVLRRGERLAKIDADLEALEWEALREHNIDELQAARVLLWAASDWLEADDVLDLVATAVHRMGWSHLRARGSVLGASRQRRGSRAVTADDTTNRYLKSWETTPKVASAGLRAWSEHLARKRTAEAEAEGRRRFRAGA